MVLGKWHNRDFIYKKKIINNAGLIKNKTLIGNNTVNFNKAIVDKSKFAFEIIGIRQKIITDLWEYFSLFYSGELNAIGPSVHNVRKQGPAAFGFILNILVSNGTQFTKKIFNSGLNSTLKPTDHTQFFNNIYQNNKEKNYFLLNTVLFKDRDSNSSTANIYMKSIAISQSPKYNAYISGGYLEHLSTKGDNILNRGIGYKSITREKASSTGFSEAYTLPDEVYSHPDNYHPDNYKNEYSLLKYRIPEYKGLFHTREMYISTLMKKHVFLPGIVSSIRQYLRNIKVFNVIKDFTGLFKIASGSIKNQYFLKRNRYYTVNDISKFRYLANNVFINGDEGKLKTVPIPERNMILDSINILNRNSILKYNSSFEYNNSLTNIDILSKKYRQAFDTHSEGAGKDGRYPGIVTFDINYNIWRPLRAFPGYGTGSASLILNRNNVLSIDKYIHKRDTMRALALHSFNRVLKNSIKLIQKSPVLIHGFSEFINIRNGSSLQGWTETKNIYQLVNGRRDVGIYSINTQENHSSVNELFKRYNLNRILNIDDSHINKENLLKISQLIGLSLFYRNVNHSLSEVNKNAVRDLKIFKTIYRNKFIGREISKKKLGEDSSQGIDKNHTIIIKGKEYPIRLVNSQSVTTIFKNVTKFDTIYKKISSLFRTIENKTNNNALMLKINDTIMKEYSNNNHFIQSVKGKKHPYSDLFKDSLFRAKAAAPQSSILIKSNNYGSISYLNMYSASNKEKPQYIGLVADNKHITQSVMTKKHLYSNLFKDSLFKDKIKALGNNILMKSGVGVYSNRSYLNIYSVANKEKPQYISLAANSKIIDFHRLKALANRLPISNEGEESLKRSGKTLSSAVLLKGKATGVIKAGRIDRIIQTNIIRTNTIQNNAAQKVVNSDITSSAYYNGMPQIQLLKRPERFVPEKAIEVQNPPGTYDLHTTVSTNISTRDMAKSSSMGFNKPVPGITIDSLMSSSNINKLVDKVYRQFEMRLRQEKKRRGI